MADLAKMILGSTERAQALIERPAALLKQNEAFRLDKLKAESDLETASDNRELNRLDSIRDELRLQTELSADDRLKRKEKRDVETHELGVKTKTETLSQVQAKNFKERQEMSRGLPEQNVLQILEFNKIGTSAQDPSAMKNRDKIMSAMLDDPSVMSALAYHPAFGGLQRLTGLDYFNATEEEKQAIFSSLQSSMDVLKTVEQRRAQEAAALAIDLTRRTAEAEKGGELDALSKAGIDPNEKEQTEGERTNIRQTGGRDFMRTVAAIGKSESSLEELGISVAAFGDMDHATFEKENEIWQAAQKSIFTKGPIKVAGMNLDFSSKKLAEGSMKFLIDNREEVSKRLGVDVMKANSPFTVGLSLMSKEYNKGWMTLASRADSAAAKRSIVGGE